MISDYPFFPRRMVSTTLLILILLRLVPFNLLHYHNGIFAGFQAVTITETQEGKTLLDNSIGTCTFHQFLDLINHGFFLESINKIISPDSFVSHTIHYKDDLAEDHFIYILNKGSPLLA